MNSFLDKIFNSESSKEFVRFCIVGIFATSIHYGIYVLIIKSFCISNEFYINVSYTIGYIISWLCNLWLTAHFTFRKELSVYKGLGFAFSHLVNYLLHIIFLNVFIFVGVPSDFAPIPVYILVIPINFVIVRCVFNRIN